MRKLIVTEFLALDGVMESPYWTMPYWNDDIAKFKGEESDGGDALLLGRVTYEGFASAWPESKDEGADYFNNVRKYVVSNTLQKADWNNSHILKGDLVQEINALKAQEGKNIVVHGSGTLVQALIKHQLVDSIRLLLYPVLVGQGKRLFLEGTMATFQLTESRMMGGGVVALIYQPAE